MNSKATGIHDIPNKALKDSAEIIAPSLSNIFNFSVASKVFPDDLKVGKIAPVHKFEIKINLTINALLQFCLCPES